MSHEACIALGYAGIVDGVATRCSVGQRCFEASAKGGPFGEGATIAGCMDAAATCDTFSTQAPAVGAEMLRCQVVPSVGGAPCVDSSSFAMSLNGVGVRADSILVCVAIDELGHSDGAVARLPLNRMRLPVQQGKNVLKVCVPCVQTCT